MEDDELSISSRIVLVLYCCSYCKILKENLRFFLFNCNGSLLDNRLTGTNVRKLYVWSISTEVSFGWYFRKKLSEEFHKDFLFIGICKSVSYSSVPYQCRYRTVRYIYYFFINSYGSFSNIFS